MFRVSLKNLEHKRPNSTDLYPSSKLFPNIFLTFLRFFFILFVASSALCSQKLVLNSFITLSSFHSLSYVSYILSSLSLSLSLSLSCRLYFYLLTIFISSVSLCVLPSIFSAQLELFVLESFHSQTFIVTFHSLVSGSPLPPLHFIVAYFYALDSNVHLLSRFF